MTKTVKEVPGNYRVIYDESMLRMMWLDLMTEPARHRFSRRTFTDFDSAKRRFSDAPDQWTEWTTAYPFGES
jgi:hypothetical protein